MNGERKHFLTASLLAISLVMALSAIAVRVLEHQSSTATKATEASTANLLSQVATKLMDSSGIADVESRVTDAARMTQDTLEQLRTEAESSVRLERAALILSHLPFIRATIVHPNVSLSLRAQVLSEQLQWLQGALPTLRRVAGYDATNDVVVTLGSRELYRRIFNAREGIRQSMVRLQNPPPAFTDKDLTQTQENAEKVLHTTVPLLKLLDSGDIVSAEPLLKEFLALSHTTADYAAQSLARMTDEAFFREMTSESQ